MALYDNREDDDAVTLEETSLTVMIDGQEYELFTAQDFSCDADFPKEVRGGPGRNKGSKNLRVKRGDPSYTFSLTLDDPNANLFGTKEVNGVEISGFIINGETYTTLADLPKFTITNTSPPVDGASKVIRLLKCEFNKASSKKSLGEASSVSLEGFALDAEGLI